MCGILFTTERREFTDEEIDAIEHRGLRYSEYNDRRFSLGVWRLPTIDLDTSADQPFVWDKYVVGFNGNIYNYRELRERLKKHGYSFKTESDTEVLIKWFDHCRPNYTEFFRGLDGDYAFVIVDRSANSVFIAVDPLSFKQLYFRAYGDRLLYVASECKPILQSMDNVREEAIFRNSVNLWGFSLLPLTPFEGILKIPSSAVLLGDLTNRKFSLFQRNELRYVIRKYKYVRGLSEKELVKLLRSKIYETIRLRAVTDQDLVIPLSGGIDSSIVAYVCSNLDLDVKVSAVNIKFRNRDYDESEYARMVAQEFGLKLHEIVTKSRLDLGELVYYYENYSDKGGVIPEFAVHHAIKKVGLGISVLSGDPADELFGGYKRIRAESREELIKYLLRKNIDTDVDKWYVDLVLHLMPSNDVEEARIWWDYIETIYYNFPKKDRASMAYTLDSRAAYYSKDLWGIAWNIDRSFKYHDGIRKYILRKAFEDVLPKEIVWREKVPFKYPGYKDIDMYKIFKEVFTR